MPMGVSLLDCFILGEAETGPPLADDEDSLSEKGWGGAVGASLRGESSQEDSRAASVKPWESRTPSAHFPLWMTAGLHKPLTPTPTLKALCPVEESQSCQTEAP